MENAIQFWASKVVCSFCAQLFQRFRVAVRRHIVAVSDAFTQRLAIVLGCAEKFFLPIGYDILCWLGVLCALRSTCRRSDAWPFMKSCAQLCLAWFEALGGPRTSVGMY